MKMKFKSMGGLTVENGRLVNDRLPGVTGIEQAARVKKTVDRSRRVDEIADGINLAEGKKNFYRL